MSHQTAETALSLAPMERELVRLLRQDGFVARIGDWEKMNAFDAKNFRGVRQLRDAMRGVGDRDWVGFQLYYPFREKELRAMNGLELVQSMTAVFAELVPAMNLWMQVPMEQ